MQGQNAYVNGYVVIIFEHYIFFCRRAGGLGKGDLGVIFCAGESG
ncbi:hypothetical protein SAMN04490207_6273 [Pseudomonas gessardii]|nr:hypothetical protein SAMN04490207_6273 [Pseudomonas gessardii]